MVKRPEVTVLLCALAATSCGGKVEGDDTMLGGTGGFYLDASFDVSQGDGSDGSSGYGGHAGKGGSSQEGGAGGEAGSSPMKLGRTCAEDDECGALKCIRSDAKDFFGGGPSGGYCTLQCDPAGPGNACSAASGDSSSFCAVLDDPPGSSGKAFCVQGCSAGPALPPDQPQTFNPNKCWGREDLSCTPFGEDPITSKWGCLPTCATDKDCKEAPGTSCDPRHRVCTAQPHSGLPFGSPCTANGPQCAGICVSGPTLDPGSAAPVSFCTERCVHGERTGCGAKESPQAGYCAHVFRGLETGIGDTAFCAQACLSDDDCLAKPDGAYCMVLDPSWGIPGVCSYP